jgi:hypothetical protein
MLKIKIARPDSIVSAQCNEERCFGTRGETLYAEVLATPQGEFL